MAKLPKAYTEFTKVHQNRSAHHCRLTLVELSFIWVNPSEFCNLLCLVEKGLLLVELSFMQVDPSELCNL